MNESDARASLGPEVFSYVPAPWLLWRATVSVTWLGIALWLADGVVDLIVQLWFNSSLGFRSIFWTNLTAQLGLFLAGGALLAVSVAWPLRRYATSPTVRRAGFHLGAWAWLLGGRVFAGSYPELLLARFGGEFGTADAVFGHDIGFLVFRLPFIWAVADLFGVAILLAMASVLVARADALSAAGLFGRDTRLVERVGLLLNPGFNSLFYGLGFIGAATTWLSRYELLYRDNTASGIRAGAEYLDVVGLFSTLNAIYFTVFVEIGVTLVIGYILLRLYRAYAHLELGGDPRGLPLTWKGPLSVLLLMLTADASFFVAVAVRDRISVTPNEPYIQREFIEAHMNGTLAGYRLENVTVVEWDPPVDELGAETMLASRTLQNAPILPGYVSYVESRSPDLQQAERFEITGTTMLYGPVLEIYQQKQQLRPYYSFLDVDAVRYEVEGERRMFVSAVREIASEKVVGPQEWLQRWGTATLLYTHGMGLVISPADRVSDAGEPEYAMRGVPPASAEPAFAAAEPRIYYGEGGTGAYVLTNIRHLREFDYATEQSRAEYVMPVEEKSGIRIDSWFKRVVLGLWTITREGNDLTAFLFSEFIDLDQTRIHLKRSPLERVAGVAPFLFLDDSNIYAVVAGDRIMWLVNGLTATANYPYSLREELGDKATDRASEALQFPTRIANWVEDSVKVTVDAFSGEVRFYKIADDPIVDAWETIYPDLFVSGDTMPDSVRAHLTYPLQWFHVQFDDVYKRYHQRNYIEFYNLEDLWDDADEVLGPIGVGLTAFGTQDESTFSYEGDHMLLAAADLPNDGTPLWQEDELQFARVMPFTPEGARNLRALNIALQDPGHYGELYSLRVPQGKFVLGPEQADAVIDADARVNQQLTLWVRHGAQVMAGHTLLVPVAGDVVYIQPIWVKSTQNAIPQIRLFAVVYRDRVTMAPALGDAIRLQGLRVAGPVLPPGSDSTGGRAVSDGIEPGSAGGLR